jgi:hypothetical protein
MLKYYTPFRNFVNNKKEANIFEIINKLLVEYYNDLLEKLKENGLNLVKYFHFPKEGFDDKINRNEILKIIYKTYISKMKNIRYIVIFDHNQHLLYIHDLK